MDGMSERGDHLDRDLGLGADLTARLRAAAGGEPDVAAARAVVGRRVVRAKRRRTAAVTGSVGLSVLVVGALVVMGGGDARGRVTSADAPQERPVVTVGGPATTATAVDPTLNSVPTATTLPTATTVPSTGAVTTAPASVDSTSPDGSSGSSGSQTLFDVTVDPGVATENRLDGVGGSVDVRVEDGVLEFASYPVAAPGFTAAVTSTEPGRLEVTFTSPTHRTRLRVRLDGTRLRADRDEETRPATSVPAPSGSGAPGAGTPVTTTHGTAPTDTTDDGDDHGGNDDNDDNDGNSGNDDNGADDDNDGNDDNDGDSGKGGTKGGSDDGSGSGSGSSGSGSGSGGSGSGGSSDD